MVEKRSFFKWAAAVLALLLLFNLPGGCTARLKGIFKDAVSPVNRFFIQTAQSLKEGSDTVRGLGGMLEENSRLSEEVIYLQAQLAERENLEQANRHLQDQLDFYTKQKRALIPCQVTARTISGWWQSTASVRNTPSPVSDVSKPPRRTCPIWPTIWSCAFNAIE